MTTALRRGKRRVGRVLSRPTRELPVWFGNPTGGCGFIPPGFGPRPSSGLQPAQAALTLRGANLSGTLSSPEPLMSSPGSVTVWIAELRAGDARAAQRLWQGYFRRLGGVARHKLRGPPPAAADEGGAGRRAPRSVC